ncbi:hypothetical protein [Lysinibacillus sp. SGAir0095]|uniref:hypothetical protein n=1 Tax=Lysinibacillus sp. SGAir0095 TaxID=2070463 RepID=UPI0010CCC7E6|nr:hypothetical protein [Lysinibacillus sp. SGAir0095]QCR33109.1 hypothetical protein C1N55_13375 [Lysinibacillus sp. SGAir0095]
MEKREVKPFIDIDVKDTIYKLSFVTGYSVKSICEDLCNQSFRCGLGRELSPYFKRGIQIDGAVFQGNKKAEKFESSSQNIERISMKVNGKLYDYAYHLSFAMESSVAKVVAYGVEKSMKDYAFLDRYIKQFLSKKIDKERKDMILKIVRTINKDYTVDEEYGIVSLLLYIADEYKRLDEGVDGVLQDVVPVVK